MKRILLLFMLFTPFCPVVKAGITLDECKEMARQNHPTIKMYGLINATRDYSISNASLQRVPSIQLGTIGGMYNNPPKLSDLFSNSKYPEIGRFIVDEILHGQMNLSDMPVYSYKAAVSLNQSIYDGGASRTAKKIAEAQALVQSAETDVTIYQVLERVDEIYFSILLLEKRILQIDSKMVVLQAVRGRAVSLRDAGASRQDDADEMDAACIEAGQQKAGLESSLKSFRIALSLLTGRDLMSEELLMPLPPDRAQIIPQTLLLDRQMEFLMLEKEKLNVAVRPRLDLIADAYYGFPNRNIYKDFTSRTPGINAFVGIRLGWNVSAFFTRKNDLAIISNSLEKLNVQKDILKLDTRLNNSAVHTEKERLRKCLEQDYDLITIRERLRKSAELSYSQGEISVDRMLSRIDEEYQARLNAQIHEIESLRESYKLKEE